MSAGLLIAAPASGSGKTCVTLALARAWRRRGVVVQCFKNGPDYIDPVFHAQASGRPCFNLDSWAMTAGAITARVAHAAADAGLSLIETSMGLFDGASQAGAWGQGSGADLAALLDWPVVLVLQPKGQSQTAAAVALGLARYRADVRVAGVILNQVASARHEAMLRAALAPTGLPVFGVLPPLEALRLPERHLGLVQAGEHVDLDARLNAAADLVASHVDLTALWAAAHRVAMPVAPAGTAPGATPPPGARIALAQDAAFAFTYPHLLQDWHAAGAAVLPFSPLADEAPDASADVCLLPGGYPELHAGRLASAGHFLQGLRDFAQTKPVHGECGGYMVLGQGLVDAQGERHAMAGLLGLETSFEQRRLHLGYRLAQLYHAVPGWPAGSRLRGHEFHYARVLAQPDDALATVHDALGQPVAETGSRRGRVTGGFFHLIAPAEPDAADLSCEPSP